MVQVIENRAEIEGRLVALGADPARPDHQIATLEVGAVAPVQGFANMFASAPGTRLELVVSRDMAQALAVGQTVRCRIRRTGPTTVFAESCSGV